MNGTGRRLLFTVGLWLLTLLCPNAPAQDASTAALPIRLVTPEILETKIQEVEAATGLGEEAKNKAFITGNLLNWSLSDPTTRILISVGIAYGSDVRKAMSLLEEAARENEVVLDDPPPSVIFQAFADNSLTMLLRCFVDSVDVRFPTISALNQAINDKFNAAGIVIAFPQRDLHLARIFHRDREFRRIRSHSHAAMSEIRSPDYGLSEWQARVSEKPSGPR